MVSDILLRELLNILVPLGLKVLLVHKVQLV